MPVNHRLLGYLGRRLGGYGSISFIEAAGTIALSIVLGRLFSAAVLGDYVFAFALGLLLSLFLGCGISHTLIIQVGRGDEHKGALLRRSIRLGLLLNLAAGFFAVIGVFAVVGWSEQRLYVYLFALSPCVVAVGNIMASYGISLDRLHPYVLFRTLVGSCRLGGILILAFYGAGILYFALLMVVVDLLYLALMWRAIWRHDPAALRGRWTFESADWPWLWGSMKIGISQFVGQVTYRVDAVMLHAMLSREVAGIYGAARTVAAAPRLLENILYSTVMPSLAAAAGRGGRGLWQLTIKISAVVTVVAILEVLVLVFGASFLIALIYGPEFGASVLPMQLLALALPVTAVAGMLRSACYCADRAGQVTRLALLVGSVNLIGNAALIPFFGIYGAVIASLSSIVLWALGLARILALPLPTPSAPFTEEPDAGDLG